MYKLEDRILFDGAAVADIADAQQEAEAQQEAAEAAEAEEAAQQEAAENADGSEGGESDSSTGGESDDSSSLESILAEIEAGNLGADGQRVDVLLVSDSLENADDIANATSSNTIVVRYDARTTSAADLLQQITDALDGNLADSIGFVTESGENAAIQLFADTDTSLDTVNNGVHQDFFNALDNMMDEGAQVNLFASNLASTTEGTALVDAIGDSLGHDVAASTDETGSESAGGDWDLEYSTNDNEVDVAETYFDENLIDNFDALLEDTASHEIAFINSSVMNVEQILDDLGNDVEVVYLEGHEGVSYVTDYLNEHSDTKYDAVHIITHGNEGHFVLNGRNVDADYVQENASEFVQWRNALSEDADIMIYGCNFAGNMEGQSLIANIASLTGADVAASVDSVGGNDWSLEYLFGDVNYGAFDIVGYDYHLTNRMVNSIIDEPVITLPDGVMTLRKAITESVDGDSITFAALTTLGGDTITLSAAADPKGYGQLEITSQISIDGTIAITGGYLRANVTNDSSAPVSENFRLLYIADTAGTSETPVDIYNMVFTAGEAEIRPDIDYVGEGNGGAIYNAGALLLRDSDAVNSSADIDGGGIYVASTGYLKIINDTGGSLYTSHVSANTAGTSGGAIFNNSGDIEILGTGVTATTAVWISGNRATGSGGAIYSVGDITTTFAYIGNNRATGGDGGGVYISGGDSLSSFSNTNIENNTAAGDGGGIYFFQSNDLNINGSDVDNNTAAGDGGGIYINESRHLRDVASSISNNTASGDGGGVYLVESGNFYHERGYIDDNTAGGSGSAIYMTHAGYGVVDGYLSDLYLYAMDISGNTANTGNGTIYYDGVRATGVEGAGTTIAYMTAIDNNTVTAGSGGAIYQLAGDLSVWSSTLAFNTANVSGGSIYFSGNDLDVQFGTLAYNESATNAGADIYLDGNINDFTVINSIIYDNDTTAETQIVINGTILGTSVFNNNIYSSYTEDIAISPGIADIVAGGTGNIVASAAAIAGNINVTRQAIIDNLYLDTEMRNYPNFYARVLPLLVDYNQDIAEGEFGHQNIAWQAGTTDYNASIEYDTRGYSRRGWQYDETNHLYVQNDNPSIGAFEPVYEIVVTTKDDNSNLIFFPNDPNVNGISLREAINWMDSYDAYSYATTDGGKLYNSDRYVKFDSDVFADDTDNTITLSSDITIAKSIIIGMTPWLNDQLKGSTYAANDISVTEMYEWGGFRAQNSTGRIIVSGNNATNIFDVTTANNTRGTRRVYINNLTATEGYADYTPANNNGRGGAIWNSTNLFLSNVAVTNSTATNTSDKFYSDAGWGGGIYNTGNLTLMETTVSGNSVIGNSSSTNPVSNAGLGGGIYSSGNLTIYSSSIYDNSSTASTYVSDAGAMGGGIYFDGWWADLTIVNTTITENTVDAEYSDAGDLHGRGSAVYLAEGDLYMYYNTVVLNHSIRNVDEAATGASAAIVSAYDYDVATTRDFDIINNIIANNDYSFTGSPKTRDLFDLYLTATDTATTNGNVRVVANIIGLTTGLTINEGTGTTNNQFNIIGDSVFGKISNLNLEDTIAYNGGKTKSYKILDNSVAYRKGLALDGSGSLPTVSIDQRGADRLYEPAAGEKTTIGSYQPLEYIVVTSTLDTRSGSDVGFDFATNHGGWTKADLQLREAFVLADIYTQVIMGDTIGETTPTVTLNQESGFGELLADIGFTLDGRTYDFDINYSNEAHAYTITVKNAQDTTINPLVIDGAHVDAVEPGEDGEGGVDEVAGSRIIRVSDNTPTNINITISYTTLQNGNSTTQGGAIYSLENLTLSHVSILDSTAALLGGGIYSQVGTLTIEDSLIQGNSVTAGDGGGLYYESNSLSIARTSFLSNTSSGKGGGFYTVGAQVDIDASTIGNNTAGTHGGGIYSDSTDIFMINSTVANNNAGENGGGIVFSGGGYLRMGYVTVANNVSGTNTEAIQKNGGGLYQSAGTLNIYNSIIAQNYQESVSADNRNDIYLGTAVSFASSEVQYNVLGVTVNNSGNSFSANNHTYDSDTGLYGELVLNIDTVLSDNGGPTQTIYVGDLDRAAVDYGKDLYYTHNTTNNTYAFTLVVPPDPAPPAPAQKITTDQRGISRYIAGNQITVGAYQKNDTTDTDLTFVNSEGDGDYTNYLNWEDANGDQLTSASQLDFNATDTRFYIAANLSTIGDWTINWRSVLILNDAVSITVDAGDTLNARVDVRGTLEVADTATLELRNNSTVDNHATATGILTVNGALSMVDTTLNGTSTLELANQAALTLATLSYAPAMTLINSSTSTTVTYSYETGTQQIIAVQDSTGAATSYGHLVLSGASAKTTSTNLSVNTLTLSGNASSLDVNGNLSITDAAAGSSVSGSSINISGNLTLTGAASTSFANVDFVFDGTSVQEISLSADTTFNSIEIDNNAGVSLDNNTLTLTDFTFTDGAFELQNASILKISDGGSVSGADGDLGHYFITEGTAAVSMQIDATSGTHFVLAVEDTTTPGTYKWVDTLITRSGASPASRAVIGIRDGIDLSVTPAADLDASITVTWDISGTSGGEFNFKLADYSSSAAGKYFDPSIGALHYDNSGAWDDVSGDPANGWTTNENGSFYIGHTYNEVWLNSDDAGTAGTLRYALANLGGDGVIVFSATHTGSEFTTGANIILVNGALQIDDGYNVSIFGLDTGNASYITGGDGEQVMIVGGSGATSETVNLRNLDLRGNGDYVLVNNETLSLGDVSVAGIDSTLPGVTWSGKWTAGTIDNSSGTISVFENSYLKLDGSADGTAFSYEDGSSLQYMLSPGEISGSITIDDNAAEFGASIAGLTVDSGVTLTLADRTAAYDINGNTAISGNLTIADDVTLSLGGATNELGTADTFTAGSGSTVNYDRAGDQTVDAVDYVNLTISGSGTKTASSSTDTGVSFVSGDLTVDSGAELVFDFATAQTVRIDGDTAVSGTLSFSGAGAGSLDLYGLNNDLGTFNYHTSTVSYLGGAQEISTVNYYNLVIGGGTVGTPVSKQAVASDFIINNDFTIGAYTTFNLAVSDMLVKGDFTMSSLGAFEFTDDGTLRLEGTTSAAFNFDDGFGTVVYQGDSSQVVAGGTYNNLDIANGIKSLGANVRVLDTFTFNADAGTFNLGTYNLYLDGAVSGASGTDGRYFANTTTVSSGKVYLLLAENETQGLTIGTASNWSELSFTGSNTEQYISIWTYDGVTTNGQPWGTPIASPEYAVDMTFNVAPQSAGSYSMNFVDSSAKGASFISSLASTYYYNSSESDWTQVSNPLTQTGPFFFGNGVPDGGLVVTNNNDSGAGSLRWAISAANILEGVNLITFSKDVFYTQQQITLVTGEINITDHVLIQGLGATLTTVSGNNSSRIFNIDEGISVSVSGLTLTGGYSTNNGGAIYLAGDLQLENVEIKDSSVSGIGAIGDAIYIANSGNLYTMRSTISSQGNTATIQSMGSISMFNSTIVELDGDGAIYLGSGENTLFNVTVSGHIYVYDDASTPEVESTLALNNTLVYGTITGDGTVTQDHSIVSTTSYFDGSLRDNGGWVRTLAIKNDATVVDAGMGYDDGAYKYDARGYLTNGAKDIGAYEYLGYMAKNASTSTYYSSLNLALGGASSGDTIEFISSRILIDSGITIDGDITLSGAGIWDTVLSAGIKGTGSDRLFTIGDTSAAPAVHMLDLSIRGGDATGNGGAILNYGNLHLKNVMLADNTASGNGGAIYNSSDAFVYGERVSIRSNSAVNGGGIYNLGSLTLDQSRVANNSADVNGGGLYNGFYGEKTGQLFLLNSTVDHNTVTDGAGGGIYSTGKFTAEYSTIYANRAESLASAAGTGLGGGIYNTGDSNLINLTIAGNYATIDGGGIYAETGAVNLVNSIVAYNTYASGWSEISDTSSVITQESNFLGSTYSGFYSAQNNLFSSSLADNGGWTYSLALNQDGDYYYYVVNQGIEVGIDYDQRGYMINETRDLGAYEVNGYIGYYLTTDNIRVYFSSIATALTAQSDLSSRTLYLIGTRIKEADINADLVYYTSDKTLAQTVTINGDASGETVISAGGTGRIFYTNATVDKGGILILNRLTLADGNALNIAGPLTDTSSSDGYGGAIYNNGAQLTLNNVNIINSQASFDGGAIYNGMAANVPTGDTVADVYGIITVTNSYFGDNFAGKNGGAVSGTGSADISASTIYGNIAGVGGGGIAITGGKNISLSNSTVAYNRAFKGLGGGVYMASDKGAATFTSGKNILARNYNGLSFDRNGTLSSIELDTGEGAPVVTDTDNAGDLYLNETNSDWYTYDGVEWALDYNIFTQYPASILTGSSAPSADDGSNGNYYVRDNGLVYRKNNDAWQSLYGLGNTVHSGTKAPEASIGQVGEYYVNTVTGSLYRKSDAGGTPEWVEQYDMNGNPKMHSGSGAPTAGVGIDGSGDYYMDTDTGNLYIRAVGAGGSVGTWSGIISTLKSSNSVSVAMDYYYSAGKFKDETYNLVEYQNGTWTEDKKTFFGEKTYDDKGKVKTDMHDILGPKENIFVNGAVADDNGGWTYTLALADDGAATDAGTGSGSDQRGYSTNGTADIGAYEFRGFVATVNSVGYDSVQSAVNAAGSGGTVTLNATRILENNISLQNNLTLEGTAGESYLSAGYAGRVLEVESSNTALTLHNLMIGEGVALNSTVDSGAGAVGNGGAIFTSGSLTMNDVQMYNSFAQNSGGAAYTVGDLTITSTGSLSFPTLFADNRANVAGGALSSSGTLSVKGSQHQGSITSKLHYLVQFQDNSAGGSGGAINATGEVGMQYFYLAHNHANQGGAISLNGTGNAKLEDFDIYYNFAYSSGGAIHTADYGNLEIRDNLNSDTEYDTYISYNRALKDGGAIYFANSGNLFLSGLEGDPLTGVNLRYNNAGNDGGGIYVNNSGNLTLDHYVHVRYGTAGNDGGGIYISNSGEFSMIFANSSSNNTAAYNGGGIYADNITSFNTSYHAVISSNTATAGSGGGVYITSIPTISIDYTEAGNNRAGVNGGFIHIANSASDTPATGNPSISITDLDAYNNSTDRTDLTVTSIDVSGDWAFIGVADPDTTVTTDPGQVSIYKLTAGVWGLHQVITGSEANDLFGYSLSVDGTNAIIGATNADGGKGTAYIYNYNAATSLWEQNAVITAPASNTAFGYSVSISGSNALISGSGPGGVGAVYLYNDSGAGWSLTETFSAPTGSRYFGHSVSISGNHILIGDEGWRNTSYEYLGAAYFYTNDGSSWSLTDTFTGTSSWGYFGGSVAISGTKAIIGAYNENSLYGEATFYDYDGSNWTLSQTVTGGGSSYYIGQSVDISGDKAVIGSVYGDSLRGAAYIYEHTGTTWNLEHTASGDYDGFGNIVAIEGDNTMVNSRDDSNVKFYSDASGDWEFNQTVNMFTTNGKGGAVYIENGNDAKITINRSGFDGNAAGQGSGLWIDHGSDISITNSTLGSNFGGSALYLGYGNLSINFATFAYNTTNDTSPVTIELDASQASRLTLTNSIIYDDATSTISLGNLTTVSSSRNLFRDVSGFSGPALHGSSYGAITAYNTDVSANVLDSNSNIVGHNANAVNFINTYSYMASGMAYHANYRTRALAITSEESLAYQYKVNGNTVRPGNNSAGLTYDQRGNSRTGYTYNTTTGKYELNSAPSIGAFEPMFYITVNDKGDMTYDPFNVIIMSGLAANAWFADAIEEDGSLNLREASYWIDSYNPDIDPFNADRYVKFDSKVFTADGDNKISLTLNAGPIEIYTSQIIGMVPGYGGYAFEADNTFMAQNDSARITIDASGTHTRVFSILDSKNPNVNVGLNNLTITGGTSTHYAKDVDSGRGGGIYNDSSLTLNNVVVTGNSTANSSLHQSNNGLGGGIYNSSTGTLTINDSTISNNTATGTKINNSTDVVGLGGGIYNDGGSVTVNRSLITANTANGFTVDPEKDTTTLAGLGGGIYNANGSMTLNNNTITANTLGSSSRNTGSAIYVKDGNLTASHNTIVDNSLPTASLGSAYSATAGAVYINGTGNAVLHNNIFANNNANGTAGFRGRDIYTSSTINVTESNNIVGYYTGSHNFSTGSGNIIGDGFGNVANLNLDSTLRYNGGKTMNFRVLSNSVATSAGTNAGSSDYDQRAYLREDGSASTIGSYEMTTAITLVTNADTVVDYSNPSIGFDFANNRAGWEASLRNAAYLADNGATITIIPSDLKDKEGNYIWTRTNGVLDPISVTNQAIKIVNGVSITTTGGQIITIDGGAKAESNGTLTGGVRLFWINSLSSGLVDVSMTNLILQNANAMTDSSNTNGGAIYNTENLTLNNVQVINSQAQQGGGIYSTNGTLTLTNKTLIDSNKAVSGGGVYVDAGNLTMTGQLNSGVYEFVKITNNTTTDSGGGLYASHATLNISLGDISNNTAKDLSETPSPAHGGGMYLVNSALTMAESQVTNNTAGFDAGGLYQNGGSASINTSTFSGNTAGRYGGGLRISAQTFEMVNSTVASNTSGSYGGGLYLTGSGSHDLTFVTIAYNVSGTTKDASKIEGGGIFIAGGNLTMTNTVIANNYHISIDDANRDEFYTTSMSWITSATYNAIGASSVGGSMLDFHTVSDTNISDTSHTDFYSDLLIDSELRNNGGATKTLYVWKNSLLVGSGTYLSDITTSQNGKDRANPPTIGAYENNPASDTYYFVGGVGDDVTDLDNWNKDPNASPGDSDTPISFSIVDGLYIFDNVGTATAALSAGTWFVGSRSTVEIAEGASFTISGTGNITVNQVGNETQTNFTTSGSGALDIRVADAAFYTPVNLTVGSSSTVTYSLSGNQTVYNKTYGNLIISGSGTKASSGAVTVAGNLSLASSNSTLSVTGGLGITGTTSGTGNISSTSDITFSGGVNSTGNIAATGTVTFDSTVDLTDSTVNAAIVTLNDVLTVNNSTISGTTALNLNANVVANGGTNSELSSPGFNFNPTPTKTITVNDADTQLTFNVGAQNVNYYGNSGIPGSDFNIDVRNVTVGDSDGSFEIKTTGNISINNISGTDDSNVNGTLVFTGNVISVSAGVDFDTAGVELNNSSKMELEDTFEVQQDLVITGPVTLTGNATLTSKTGDLGLTGTVTGDTHNLTLNGANVATGTYNRLGILDINATTAVAMDGNINATSIDVSGDATISGNSTLTSSGNVLFNNKLISASGANVKLIGSNIDVNDILQGAGNLTLQSSGVSNTLAGSAMTGNLSLSKGSFTTSADMSSADLNIESPATLTMGALNLTATGNLTNAGNLNSTSTGVVTVGGNVTNTSTGNMAISTALNINGSGTSTLNLGGTVDLSTATLTLGASKNAILNNSIAVNNFAFTEVAKPESRFTLSSGVSLDVTGSIDYKLGSASGLDVYDGNYFVTSGGGQLVQTMANGADVIYRVGNNDSTTVVTLSVPNDTEKIAVKVMDSIIIRNEVVTGIADTTRFTTVISRDWDGQGSSGAITTSLNWANALNGPGFTPSKGVLFSGTGDAWYITTTSPTVTVDTDGLPEGRSWTNSYTLPHNGTYAVANIDAAMTGTFLNGNVALWEMASPKPLSMSEDLDVDDVTNFPIGTYPYFTVREYKTAPSVGEEIYKQMQYRLVSEPITNLLGGQVPPIGSVVGQAITEGASLTLTTDAPVYLEVNGEYSIGENWLPLGTPASAGNIENFQAPITQGQLDEFYLEFGGQKGALDTPESFKSDLDEMLDDLLAG